MRRLASCLGLGLALTLAVTGPARADAQPAQGSKGLTVTVTRPQTRLMTETLLATGSLKAREEIQIGPEVEGYRLIELLADVGDRVEKGQVLARLSRDMLQVQLAQNTANGARAEAAIAQQRATLDQMLAQETEATSAVDRARQLRKTGVISQEALDERERAVKVAAAQVAATRQALLAAEADAKLVKAQRDEIELRMQRTEVRSPEAGVILTRDARVGSIVLSTRSDPLFRIAKNGAIDLEAEVPEASMPRIAVGQRVEVTPAGFTKPVQGEVRLISAQLDKSTRLGNVEIALPENAQLRPGTYARGLIEIGRREGLVVPQSAVLFDAKGAYVLVVTDGIVAERRVEPGLKDDGRVELVHGVSASDQVVVRAGGFLREGDHVTPVEALQTAKDAR
ncbi:efflux RND transporter periplasmic adaptor subunit [Aquabacter sp. L1I39]|uniref:efflux RND transporter periplasmic adaptor subunit n=1 Tax=Aquabacter sp. L1I39 TaxID=2820278 RepID=UPI001ADC9A81|nr:efflux RND transporter periplasmic adaptor subunit [Aquabacter sp. L1I39]QTL04836.1 efflux RND transporter periplasmic adaptor subunit [Aquabacter sp. L1I39]